MSFDALRTVAQMRGFPLEASARLVLYTLADHHNQDNGQCFPSQSTIAEEAGVSRNTVPRALQSLVDAKFIRIVTRGGLSARGGRRSDSYVFLFPLLKAGESGRRTMVDIGKSHSPHDGNSFPPPWGAIPPTMGDQSDSNQEIEPDSVGENASDPMVDFSAAVDLLWKSASDAGRQRSSKGDIETALKAAVKRGPGTPVERMERIMRGMGAWFRSAEATKDDGSFQAGVHRKIVKDRWAGYLDDEEARAAAGQNTSPAAAKAAQTMGTIDAPSPARQKLWMELFNQGMPWDEERGPKPGRLGCRVSDEIQLQFGVTPYHAAGDDDSAAFD